MPVYVYQCQDCSEPPFERFFSFADYVRYVPCGACGGDAYVVIQSPSIAKSTLRHEATFDHSLGSIVTGQKDREEIAKRLEQKDGRKIAFVDPHDTKGLGVNDDGLDATRRQKQNTGKVEGTKHFV